MAMDCPYDDGVVGSGVFSAWILAVFASMRHIGFELRIDVCCNFIYGGEGVLRWFSS